MPKGNDVEHGELYIVFYDETSVGLFDLLLPFVATANLKGEISYLKICNARKRDFVLEACLVEEKGFTHIAKVCVFRTQIVDEVCVVKIDLLNFSEVSSMMRQV